MKIQPIILGLKIIQKTNKVLEILPSFWLKKSKLMTKMQSGIWKKTYMSDLLTITSNNYFCNLLITVLTSVLLVRWTLDVLGFRTDRIGSPFWRSDSDSTQIRSDNLKYYLAIQ